jgi:hypothetical protein
MLSAVFGSGLVADLLLGFMLVEAVSLFAYHRRTGHGLAPVDLACSLAAGAFLVLALRAALTDAWWGWIALALTGALGAHLTDLARRWKS